MVYLVADDGSGGKNGTAGAPDLGNIELIGSIPDSMIADELTGTPSTYTFNNVANALPGGTADEEYWVVMDFSSDNSSAEWVYNADDTGIGTADQLGYTDVIRRHLSDRWQRGPWRLRLAVNTPEPATVALLGGAMAALGFLRRRRNKTAA